MKWSVGQLTVQVIQRTHKRSMARVSGYKAALYLCIVPVVLYLDSWVPRDITTSTLNTIRCGPGSVEVGWLFIPVKES